MDVPKAFLVGVLVAALSVAGCGSSASTSTSSTGRKLTPGGGKGATHPPPAYRLVRALIPPAGAPVRTVHVPVLTITGWRR